MGDGSSGNLGGILFEAGKSAVKATGNAVSSQAQQTANSAFSSVTGSQNPLFKSPGGNLPKSPFGQGGQMPKQNPFGGANPNFGKMFEGGGMKSPFGPKQPVIPPTPQISQAELDAMAKTNQANDAIEIEKRQKELRELQEKARAHKQLHDEVYYNPIKRVGEGMTEQTRQARAQAEEQEEAQKAQEEQAKQMDVLPGSPLAQGQQLGQPVQQQDSVAVFQSKTKTEIGRGTTG